MASHADNAVAPGGIAGGLAIGGLAIGRGLAIGALASVGALTWAGAAWAGAAWAGAATGPVSAHMVMHIGLMSAAAPLAAWLSRPGEIGGRGLAWAAIAQLVALWSLHAPPLLSATHGRGAASALAGAALFLGAFGFWRAVLAQRGARRWRAILALLITAKLYCLLGALLVFAPRALYPALAGHGSGASGALADQQLAGLLMLAACGPTYVGAGVLSAARWLHDLAEFEAAGAS